MLTFSRFLLTGLVLLAGLLGGCTRPVASIQSFDTPALPNRVHAKDADIVLFGAGGEWLEMVVEVSGDATRLRVAPLTSGLDAIPPATRAYRIVDLPFDTNRADYVRLTGEAGGRVEMPRALVPLAGDGRTFDLPVGSAKIWIEFRLPPGLTMGNWHSELQAISPDGEMLDRLPIRVASHGFDLPYEPTLTAIATLSEGELSTVFPGEFSEQTFRSIRRSDPADAAAVRLLDALMRLSADHGMSLAIPELTPAVKWPSGAPPQFDWESYDALTGPWLDDAAGPRHWPLPRVEGLEEYPPLSRFSYWKAVAEHFEGQGWMERSAAWVESREIGVSGSLSLVDRARLSVESQLIQQAIGTGELAVDMEADQIRFAGPDFEGLYDPAAADRLRLRAEGIVTDDLSRPWPAGIEDPAGTWFDATTVSGPEAELNQPPAVTAGDVRGLGWAAFLRQASVVRLASPLPIEREDASRIAWFYPGEWVGSADAVVPSTQLKWLRRAWQDHAHLTRAADAAGREPVEKLARSLTRPLRVPAAYRADPVFALLVGTADRSLWDEGIAFSAELARTGRMSSVAESWIAQRDAPTPLVTMLRWDLAELDPNAATPPTLGGDAASHYSGFRRDQPVEQVLYLRAEVALYNAAEATPEGFTLAWSAMPGGGPGRGSALWNPLALERSIPAPVTGEIGFETVAAWARLDDLATIPMSSRDGAAGVRVRDGFTGAESVESFFAPAAVLDRSPAAPMLDGSLAEWSATQAILRGPAVPFHDRSSLRGGESPAMEAIAVYATWTNAGLHVAFRLPADPPADAGVRTSTTFVETQSRRIWGEDAAELLIQPLFITRGDPDEGPLVHLVLKPNGQLLAERRLDRPGERRWLVPWQPVAADLRYATGQQADGTWFGELTIPWTALNLVRFDGAPPTPQELERIPELIRFNLSHHRGATGRSASWAGPIDHGRDDQVMGALIIRRDE